MVPAGCCAESCRAPSRLCGMRPGGWVPIHEPSSLSTSDSRANWLLKQEDHPLQPTHGHALAFSSTNIRARMAATPSRRPAFVSQGSADPAESCAVEPVGEHQLGTNHNGLAPCPQDKTYYISLRGMTLSSILIVRSLTLFRHVEIASGTCRTHLGAGQWCRKHTLQQRRTANGNTNLAKTPRQRTRCGQTYRHTWFGPS